MFTSIDICYFLLFWINCFNWLCLYKSLVKKILRYSNSSNLLFFYLFMSIDNTTWHARIGMFYISKPFLKSKSIIRKFSAYFTLIFILEIILFYFNKVFFFSCIAIKTFNILSTFIRKTV